MSQTALYFQLLHLVTGSGPATGAQGLSSICNGVTWPAEGALLPAAAQGFLQVLFLNHLSGLSPHLVDVGSSWHWVVDAVDGEDNRGQGIDSKT